MHTFIRLDAKQQEFFSGDEALNFLRIDKLNIILGANNSRKSRLIRSLLKQKNSVIIESPVDLNFQVEILNNFAEFLEGRSDHNFLQLRFHSELNPKLRFGSISTDDPNPRKTISISYIRNRLMSIMEEILSFDGVDGFESTLSKIKALHDEIDICIFYYEKIEAENGNPRPIVKDETSNWSSIMAEVPGQDYSSYVADYVEVLELLSRIIPVIREILAIKFVEVSHKKIYIPSYRTSHFFPGLKSDIFEDNLIRQYELPGNNIIIHTGMKLYENIITAKTGTRAQIRNITEFESFIGKTFFNSEIHITAHYEQGGTDRKIAISLPGEREDTPIYDLGDGIQNTINLLFPVFTATDNSLIFIDEPENHLHPGFQSILIDALINNEFLKSKKLCFFISSHSNHILAGALMESGNAEVLFAKRRDENSSSLYSFDGNEHDLLESLGVLNTSVLVSNCMIWVEGITDRLYVRAILKAYIDSLDETYFKPTEGFHYSFIEYAGKNLSHYSFDGSPNDDSISSFLISTNIFLIADSDFDKKKHSQFRVINRSNFRFFETNLPEMENLIPGTIIRDFFETKSCTKESLNKCFPMPEPIKDVKLGKHFQDKLFTSRNKPLTLESDGGTLSSYYKMGLANFFYNKVFDGTYKWNVLQESTGLKSLCISLYEFIKAKNKTVDRIKGS